MILLTGKKIIRLPIKKVKEAAQQLTNDNKSNKVKLQLEMLGADASANKISSLNRQMSILNDMVDTQRKKVLLSQNAYSGMVGAAANEKRQLDMTNKTSEGYKGLASKYEATRAASVAMTKQIGTEQVALAKLEAQLRTTTASRAAAYNAYGNKCAGGC